MMRKEELFAIATLAKETMLLTELSSILEEINAELISRASLGYFVLNDAVTYEKIRKHIHDDLGFNDFRKAIIEYYENLGYHVWGSCTDLNIAWYKED